MGPNLNSNTPNGPAGLPDDLVGAANEANIVVNGKNVQALIDTGSQVSTISHSFVEQHCSELDIHPVSELLRVDDAGGNAIPYLGYVNLNVNLIPTEQSCEFEVPFLVVKDTEYHSKVPVLIGVSVIRHFTDFASEMSGENFVQKLQPPSAVALGIRAAKLQQRHLEKSKGVYADVKVFQKETIPARSSLVIAGKTKVMMEMPDAYVCVEHATAKGKSIDGVTVNPCVVRLQKTTAGVLVDVVNNNDHDVTLHPGTLIARLHGVTLTTPSGDTSDETEFIDKFDLSHLGDFQNDGKITEEQVGLVHKFLIQNKAVFCQNSNDIGHQTLFQHPINLTDDTPIKQRCRPIPPHLYEELQQHLQQLLDMGVIAESDSPWSQNLVYVRKRDGSLRICQDFRALNAKTIKDAYEIPRIHDLLNVVQGMKWVTSLDMAWSYWQTDIRQSDQAKTAFSVGHLGHFQWKKMAFGLCNAPASQQKLMSRVLKGLLMKCCVVYLDDVLIFSNSFEQHLKDVQMVMDRLVSAGLKIKPGKCEFFKKSVKFLGHIVSEDGIKTSPEYVESVSNYPTPTSPKDIERFLGLAGFYRRFIKDYSAIAQPLSELLEGRQTGRGKKQKRKPSEGKFEWGDRQQKAFDTLKHHLTTAPVLQYPDFSRRFIVRTDASGLGLGAVLCQEDDHSRKVHVVAYASRSLRKGERHYSAYKLEFKALHWAVTNKFKEFLTGNRFIVTTDHNPLTYILSSARLDATTIRWVGELASFDFEVRYKRGCNNKDADALSRIPKGPENCITTAEFQSLCRGLLDQEPSAQVLLVNSQTVSPVKSNFNYLDWSAEQENDPSISKVRKLIRSHSRLTPEQLKNEDPTVRGLMRVADRLVLQNNVLYKQSHEYADDEEDLRLVLPVKYHTELFKLLHCDGGHLGRDKTIALFQDRVYWPGMVSDVTSMVARCDRCKMSSGPNAPHAAALHPIVTTQPLELVCIDYLKLDKCSGGFENVLVVTDHFTRYAQAYPTKNETALVTAKALYDKFFVNYGFPRRLHSDQGKTFTGKVIQALCDITGVEKSRTTPYHPMGNGKVENFNKTLISMVRSMPDSYKRDWKSHLSSLCHAYNSTVNASTGYTPFYLMFGRKPRLPADAFLGLSNVDSSKYVKSVKERLDAAYKSAAEAAEKAGKKNKRHYDLRKCRGAVPEVGDRVLVKAEGFKDRHKLKDVWEPVVHVVLDQPNPDVPVYRVQGEGGKGRVRILHRNMLLPLQLPLVDWSSATDKQVSNSAPTPKVPVVKSAPKSSTAPAKVTNVPSQSADVHEDEAEVSTVSIDVIPGPVPSHPAADINVPVSEPPTAKVPVPSLQETNTAVPVSVEQSEPVNREDVEVIEYEPDHDSTLVEASDITNLDLTVADTSTSHTSSPTRLTPQPIVLAERDQEAADSNETIAYDDSGGAGDTRGVNDTTGADSDPGSDEESALSSFHNVDSNVEVPIRRSGRERKPPDWYNSYVVGAQTSWERKLNYLQQNVNLFAGNQALLQSTIASILTGK